MLLTEAVETRVTAKAILRDVGGWVKGIVGENYPLDFKDSEVLDQIYKKNLLEKHIQNPSKIAVCFIYGRFKYRTKNTMTVDCLKRFINLLRSNSKDRQRIILNHIHNRLDTIERFDVDRLNESDIPF